MSTPPNLLSDDGSASMATMLMMSHHAFRRDVARFISALGGGLSPTESARAQALREEWANYRGALHGHHHVEDTGMFPSLRAEHTELGACIDGLAADHARIDPLLARGDETFAQLPQGAAAALAVVTELSALLDAHLAVEEAELVPHLRAAKGFPPPGNDEEAAMYAQGFAWSSQGIAPDVLQQVYALLPEILTSRLPDARAAFEERCRSVWGAVAVGSSRTPIPDA
jgi:hypothetical protein